MDGAAVMLSASNGRADSVRLLMDAGASKEARCKRGGTALKRLQVAILHRLHAGLMPDCQ